MTEPLVIHIERTPGATSSSTTYVPYRGWPPQAVTAATVSPYIDAAAAILGAGEDPARRFVMRWRGDDRNLLDMPLALAATLTINPVTAWTPPDQIP